MKRQMKKLLVVAGSALLIGATGQTAEAVPLVLNLDCIIGNNTCTSSAVYGQIVISQVDTTTVNILVDLTPIGTAGSNKINDVFLNYGGTLPNSAFFLSAASTPTSLHFDQALNPFHSAFDFKLDPRARSFDPYSVNLGVTSGTLSVGNFNLPEDTFDLLYGAVHIGTCGPDGGVCQPGVGGNNSIKVGSLGPTAVVPEPATLLTLGTGLLGLVRYRTRGRSTRRSE